MSEQRLDTLALPREPSTEGFSYLTSGMAGEIGRMLGNRRALYIETEYWGGEGGQCATLFENGAIVWHKIELTKKLNKQQSPLSCTTRPAIERTKSPISQGLDILGVRPERGKDEFDVVGLGRFRTLKDLGLQDEM